MINVSQAWKDNIYNAAAEKKIIFTVGATTFGDNDIQDRVEIQETCTNGSDIKIGSCIASSLKFSLSNKGLNVDFANNEINIQVGIKIPSTGEFEFVPMGIFKVNEIDKTDERVFKIVAYDRMKLFEKDCTEFLATRTYPITLWSLTQQLCGYVGIELENTSITNGDYLIEENFKATDFTSQQLLTWIGEVAASFIDVNRYGKLVFKAFSKVTNNVTDRDYINFTVAKHTVPQITRVQVAVEEDDLGVIIGSGNVTYAIINNPLLYTKSTAQITPVITNILTALNSIPVYAPCKLYGKGNPAIETGDIITVTTVKGVAVDIMVMDRKFVYQKSFRDTYESFGTTTVGAKRIVQNSLIQLKGKMNILTRTLEKNVLKVADLEIGYNEMTQTVNQNKLEIADVKGNVSAITQSLDSFKVEINNTVEGTKTEVKQYTDQQIGQIELTPGPKGDKGDTGAQGPPGTNGQTLYTWVKYADTPTSGMSDSPTGKAYMGIAVNKATATESTNYSDYTWSLTKGEQGVPGQKGTDGQTTYTWVKYADTPTSGMSDDPTNKKYIGLAFNKTTAVESTNYADYAWSLMPQNVDLTNYYTKTETNTQINTAKDSINLSVDTKINTATTTINQRTDTVLTSYSTTQQMNAAISLKGAEIDASVSQKIIGTYYQATAPSSPKAKEIWYQTLNQDFIIGANNSFVIGNSLGHVIGATNTIPSKKAFRYNGVGWDSVTDSDIDNIKYDIAGINISVDGIVQKVEDSEGRIGSLEVTANGILGRVTDAEGNISELQLTSTDLLLRVQNAELNIGTLNTNIGTLSGQIDNIKLTTNKIELATSNSKLEFDSSGLTINNGGFKIMQGSATLLSSTGGNLYLRGEVRTGWATLNGNGLYLQPYQTWDGTPSGGRIYFNTSVNQLYIDAIGWGIYLGNSDYYHRITNVGHTMTGNLNLSSGDLSIRGEKFVKKRLADVKTYDYVLSLPG